MSDPVLLTVRHLPGPAWVSGLDPRRQPGIEGHAAHYRVGFEEGRFVLGGPFLGADLGGMVVAAPGTDREGLEAFAAADPAVSSGLIRWEIRAWFTPMRRTDLLGSSGPVPRNESP